MKLKVLGSCSPYTKDNKNGIGFLMTEGEEKIIIDAGSGISKNLNFPQDLNNLSIIISHFHRDHYAELLPISYAGYIYSKSNNVNRKIKVYIPNDLESEDRKYIEGLVEDGYYEFIPYEEDSILNIANINFSFKKTLHGPLTFAMKITDGKSTICYSADTGYGDGYLTSFVNNADLFICETTYLNNQFKPKDTHLKTLEAANIAKNANVKKLMIDHFWPDIDKNLYLEECKTVFENVIVANENEEFDF